MKEQLKSFVKGFPFVLRFARNFRDGHVFSKGFTKSIKGSGNVLKFDPSVRLIHCEVDIKGSTNQISIEKDCLLKNVKIFIRGNKNKIHIAKEVQFNRGGELWIEDENCELYIGDKTTFEDTHIAVTETNSKVQIGSDCMFANDIDIRTGDSHSIIDTQTDKRINYAKNVEIADHVWVGAHCSLLKGSYLATNSIVATRSVVTKKFEDEGVLIAGIPAKIIKDNVNWDRARIS